MVQPGSSRCILKATPHLPSSASLLPLMLRLEFTTTVKLSDEEQWRRTRRASALTANVPTNAAPLTCTATYQVFSAIHSFHAEEVNGFPRRLHVAASVTLPSPCPFFQIRVWVTGRESKNFQCVKSYLPFFKPVGQTGQV